MRVVITHLTRMSPGYVCVAGVDLDTGKHVRPVRFGRLPVEMTTWHRGDFDISAVIDFGRVQAVGSAPEVEDYRFSDKSMRALGSLSADQLWLVLKSQENNRLSTIFGSELELDGLSCSMPAGRGAASLGVLLPVGTPQLRIDNYGKLRLFLSDGDLRCSISVTDLRFYDKQWRVRSDVVESTQGRLDSGTPCLVCVGLTRPWAREGETERHWLQVNNLHLSDEPLWLLNEQRYHAYSGPLHFLERARPKPSPANHANSSQSQKVPPPAGSTRSAVEAPPQTPSSLWSRLTTLFRRG